MTREWSWAPIRITGEKPALKTATFKFIPDAAAAVAAIMAGDVDAFANFPAGDGGPVQK